MALKIFLCRHGETPWTVAMKHTSFTDISLTEHGKIQAEELGKRLEGISFKAVFSSPLKRALETCQLAGFTPKIEPLAVEWNYGQFEGVTTEDIHKKIPDWTIFTHGAPGGESPEQVGKRADKLIENLRKQTGNIALFSHGHFMRVLCARWLDLPPQEGSLFSLSVASISILGYERKQPVIKLWNDT